MAASRQPQGADAWGRGSDTAFCGVLPPPVGLQAATQRRLARKGPEAALQVFMRAVSSRSNCAAREGLLHTHRQLGVLHPARTKERRHLVGGANRGGSSTYLQSAHALRCHT